MNLDWCECFDDNLATKFNDSSIISLQPKNKTQEENNKISLPDIIKTSININDCFCQNTDITNSKELLNILNYLSFVSNHLRTLIRNKGNKNYSVNMIDEEFDQIVKYLIWIKNSTIKIKKFFAISFRKDNSFDPNNIKPFKTSSYKFCNFKEQCAVHTNKNKTCDKNHFVFDMIVNDINKLIDSMNLLGLENFNWVLNNNALLILYDVNTTTYSVSKINYDSKNKEIIENQFIIDCSLIFKSFDVSSYVLNKMYEESYTFLNFDVQSYQIHI